MDKANVVPLSEVYNTLKEDVKNSFFGDLVKNITKSGFTAEEIFYLFLLYEGNVSYIYEYVDKTAAKKGLSQATLDRLFEEDYITTNEWSKGSYPDEPVLTKKGEKLVEKIVSLKSKSAKLEEIEEFGEELIRTYPSSFTSGDRAYPTKGFSAERLSNGKTISGRGDAITYYYELIRGSRTIHNQVIALIEHAKSINGLNNSGTCQAIKTTLMKFIVNKGWTEINTFDKPTTFNKLA